MEVQERQRRGRVKISRQVRVRPSDPYDKHFDEVRVTVSASPSGLYFNTRRNSYCKGMRLFVTIPYFSGSDTMNCDYLGEVLRVDELPDGRYGIAVRLVASMNLAPLPGSAGSQRK